MAMEFRSADLTDIAACVVEELRPEAQRKHIDPALSAAVIPRRTVDPRERQSGGLGAYGDVSDTDGCADQRAGPGPTGGSDAGHRPAAEAGRRFTLAFVLAVAAVCVLAGTRNFREAGEQAADLLQEAPVE